MIESALIKKYFDAYGIKYTSKGSTVIPIQPRQVNGLYHILSDLRDSIKTNSNATREVDEYNLVLSSLRTIYLE